MTDKLNDDKHSGKFEKTRAARVAAVQAHYQSEINAQTLPAVMDYFLDEQLDSSDYPYPPHVATFKGILSTRIQRADDIAQLITQSLSENWSLERLEPLVRAILSIGTAELLSPVTRAPAPVIITEYVDIARGFFDGNEPAFVNGVLDKIAQGLHLRLQRD
ncbi:MAG: transcription antitermination factor NusB [Holosporales bacterium]